MTYTIVSYNQNKIEWSLNVWRNLIQQIEKKYEDYEKGSSIS
jgi:hypothetical protein